MDEDGYLYIVDRTEDMLISVIEEAIDAHLSVEEAAVIGVPDAYHGETLKAFVVLKAGAPPLELDDLQAFLQDKLGKHAMIGALEVRPVLPTRWISKISKKDLRRSEAKVRGG